MSLDHYTVDTVELPALKDSSFYRPTSDDAACFIVVRYQVDPQFTSALTFGHRLIEWHSIIICMPGVLNSAIRFWATQVEMETRGGTVSQRLLAGPIELEAGVKKAIRAVVDKPSLMAVSISAEGQGHLRSQP